jgi:hypothetical protein
MVPVMTVAPKFRPLTVIRAPLTHVGALIVTTEETTGALYVNTFRAVPTIVLKVVKVFVRIAR